MLNHRPKSKITQGCRGYDIGRSRRPRGILGIRLGQFFSYYINISVVRDTGHIQLL
jgi:hypothetical protein